MIQPSRLPSFTRKEEGAQPESKKSNMPLNATPKAVQSAFVHQVPAKVDQFLQRAKRVANTQATAQVHLQHGPIGGVQRTIVIRNPQWTTWFSSPFFNRLGFYPPYYRQRNLWWGGASWLVINNYLGWGWDAPYDYQSGTPVIVTPPPVTNITQYTTNVQAPPATPETPAPEAPPQTPAAPATQAPEQAAQPAAANPAEQGEWLPLGVFAAGRTMADIPFAHQFVQLNVNKEGVLSGAIITLQQMRSIR